MVKKGLKKRSREEEELEAKTARSNWQRFQEVRPKRRQPGFAQPKSTKPKYVQEVTELSKVPEDPKDLSVLFLVKPNCWEFYKPVFTYKASFSLEKIKDPNEISGDPCMSIHVLFQLIVFECKERYREGTMKVNEKVFDYKTPAEPLNTVVKYKKLLEELWPALGIKRFGCKEKFWDYQPHKHNFENRYPKDVFLLNGLVLGNRYIKRILEIMHSNDYVAGERYNCKQFVKHIEEGLQVKVEVKFQRLEHKTDLFGLKKIGTLFNDEDWEPRNFVPKPGKEKHGITDISEFILEDFVTSVEERVHYAANTSLHKHMH